jgi:hypothetical protein
VPVSTVGPDVWGRYAVPGEVVDMEGLTVGRAGRRPLCGAVTRVTNRS